MKTRNIIRALICLYLGLGWADAILYLNYLITNKVPYHFLFTSVVGLSFAILIYTRSFELVK